MGRRRARRAGREPERAARALHGGLPRGRRRVPRAPGRSFRPLDSTPSRRARRFATGPPTVATRTRRGTASSPRRCGPCWSRRSGPTEGHPVHHPARDRARARRRQVPLVSPASDGRPERGKGSRDGADDLPEALTHVGPLLRPEHPPERRPGTDLERPAAVAELDWVREPGDVDVAVADVTPDGTRRQGR